MKRRSVLVGGKGVVMIGGGVGILVNHQNGLSFSNLILLVY